MVPPQNIRSTSLVTEFKLEGARHLLVIVFTNRYHLFQVRSSQRTALATVGSRVKRGQHHRQLRRHARVGKRYHHRSGGTPWSPQRKCYFGTSLCCRQRMPGLRSAFGGFLSRIKVFFLLVFQYHEQFWLTRLNFSELHFVFFHILMNILSLKNTFLRALFSIDWVLQVTITVVGIF